MTSLSRALRLNAASCLGFGALFAILPGRTAAFLGDVPPVVFGGLGLALLVNGIHLAVASRRSHPRPAEILWFSIGDLAWWAATLGLLAAGIWITSPMGVVAAAIVALVVAGLGVTQLFLLGRHRSGLSAQAHLRRIGRSWWSLPTWVKAWLFALNALFLASPAVLPWAEARVVLIAYAASGPLLAGFAAFDGGLSRAMGIGHLVPWSPLLVWLATGIAVGDGPGSGFAQVLLVATAACLALDLADIVRWLRGERAIMLTPDAGERHDGPRARIASAGKP